jgi:hypothetical protein
MTIETDFDRHVWTVDQDELYCRDGDVYGRHAHHGGGDGKLRYVPQFASTGLLEQHHDGELGHESVQLLDPLTRPNEQLRIKLIDAEYRQFGREGEATDPIRDRLEHGLETSLGEHAAQTFVEETRPAYQHQPVLIVGRRDCSRLLNDIAHLRPRPSLPTRRMPSLAAHMRPVARLSVPNFYV